MNRKIHLVFHIRSMEIGGIQKVLLEYLANLPREEFEISLITSLYQGELINEIPKDIRTYFIGNGKEFLSKNKYIQKLQLVIRRIKLAFYQKFPNLLYRKLHRKPNIEIAFDIPTFQWVANSPVKDSKKISWLHNDLKNTHANENITLHIIALMKKFDACIMVSDFAKNNIKKYYNTEFKSSFVVNNPVNTKDIQKKSNEFNTVLPHPCFIGAGRLTKSKAYDLLLVAHHHLIQEGHQHYIAILGDGPERNKLSEEIGRLGVEKTFLLLGNKTNPYPYFKEADFFIHPSLRESYPMVILENLLLNKPIISTNVGGIPEIIDNGINGVLINPNEDEIYNAMKDFLTQPEWVNKIKQGTKNSSERFNENKIYQQVIDIFKSILK